MPTFPTTTDELNQYISDYMDAHIAERITEITDEAIAQAVDEYMRTYGAAMEDNGQDGEVPLVANDFFTPENMGSVTMPLAVLSGGVPASYIQARIRALALAAASLITSQDVKIPVVQQTASVVTIEANVLNTWNSTTGMSGIAVSFAPADADKVNEYLLRITVNEDAFTLTLPSGVTWADEAPAKPGLQTIRCRTATPTRFPLSTTVRCTLHGKTPDVL